MVHLVVTMVSPSSRNIFFSITKDDCAVLSFPSLFVDWHSFRKISPPHPTSKKIIIWGLWDLYFIQGIRKCHGQVVWSRASGNPFKPASASVFDGLPFDFEDCGLSALLGTFMFHTWKWVLLWGALVAFSEEWSLGTVTWIPAVVPNYRNVISRPFERGVLGNMYFFFNLQVYVNDTNSSQGSFFPHIHIPTLVPKSTNLLLFCSIPQYRQSFWITVLVTPPLRAGLLGKMQDFFAVTFLFRMYFTRVCDQSIWTYHLCVWLHYQCVWSDSWNTI